MGGGGGNVIDFSPSSLKASNVNLLYVSFRFC